MGREQVAAIDAWLPSYPNAAPTLSGPDDAEVWLRARALYEVWARAGHLVPMLSVEEPEDEPDRRDTPMEEAIKAERLRVAPQGRPIDRLMLWGTAVRLVSWARQFTRETNTLVLARYAVEGAYDLHLRLVVGATLGGVVAPSTWWWQGVRQFHASQPRTDGYQPAIRGDDAFRLREQGLDVAALLRAGHVAEPRWPIKRTHVWIVDALRPPLVAMQIAAWVIRRELGSARRVLAVELGHSVGPQALSCWLPESRIEAHSMFTSHREVTPAPAVVLGVPCLRLVAWAVAVTDPNVVFSRADVAAFEAGRFRAPPPRVDGLVACAAKVVAPGGVLLVVGDIEDGVHHQANDVLLKLGFTPVRVTRAGEARDLVEQPIFTHFPPPVWRPFGVLAPTDRLVSAWRRPA